jgi:hypothetical protein
MERCERAGVPAVGIFGEGFIRMAEILARQAGIPRRRLIVYPGMIATEAADRLVEVARTVLTPLVVAGIAPDDEEDAATALARPATPIVTGDAPEEDATTSRPTFTGTLDAVQDHFESRGWTDGLPIVPPTPDRVEAFLRHTPRDAHEVLGVYPPEHREATVRTVAAHGVMAGCRPEYMPILVAIAGCIAEPYYRLEDAGSTPGWEPLVIVSGPLVRELDFNAGTGVMRVGRRANTSVGRFTRLLLRNVAGFRIPPGVTDQAGFGMTFNVAMAEDDDAVAVLGWPTFREDRGFAPADTVVTVQGSLIVSTPIYTHGDDPSEHLGTICEYLGHAIAPNVGLPSLKRGGAHNVLAMSPSIARVFASNGIGKPEIVRALVQGVRAEARTLQGRGTAFDIHEWAREGRLPLEYALSDDPRRLIRLMEKEEYLSVVVSGNPDRNQSRAYIGNHVQGAPVSRRVEVVGDGGDGGDGGGGRTGGRE